MDLSEIFWECREWQILGVVRKESWILDRFEIFGNRCQTEYDDATWRTTWSWRRSAGSDCVLVMVIKQKCYFSLIYSKNSKKNTMTPMGKILAFFKLS